MIHPQGMGTAALVLGMLAIGPGVALLVTGRNIAIWCWLGVSVLAFLFGKWAQRSARLASLPETTARRGATLGGAAIPLGMLVMCSLPGFMSGRASQNEARAIQHVRHVVFAQAKYAEGNGGLFAPLDRLSNPGLASLAPHMGYRREFHPDPATVEEILRAKAAPGSLRGFAYVAVPLTPPAEDGFPSGHQGICGDASGRVCFTSEGVPPQVRGGRCPLPRDSAQTCGTTYEEPEPPIS